MPNLFSDIPSNLDRELTEQLVNSTHVRIERIISNGQSSAEGFWYDQDEHEWVIVLQGRAKLLFEGDDGLVDLAAGDFINIPAHKRHRVEWTDPVVPTVWLAVHYSD